MKTSNKMLSRLIFVLISTLVAVAMAESSELQILQSNGQFTNKLYKILSAEDGNVFFSPISAHTVLSMSYLGAAGSTEQAYVTALGLPSQEATADGYEVVTSKLNNVPNVTLLIANKVYVNSGHKLKSKFQNAVTKKFHSEVQSINFAQSQAAAREINTWVEDKTKNKIKDLVQADDFDALTRLVLVNAIYFKGNWKNKFNKDLTRTEPFYLNAKDTIDVQMMHINEKFNFKQDENLKAKIVELPYNNPEISMVIILPDERDGIKELETKLENVDLTKIMDGSWNTEVHLALPKFRIETKIRMEEPLRKMGLGVIFDRSNANFSNLLEGHEPLYVSKVIQKAFIEVNEEGAEAAAATALVPQAISSYKRIVVHRKVRADHPFISLVLQRDNNVATILFHGKVGNPLNQYSDTNCLPCF